jgi:hypothetical protein
MSPDSSHRILDGSRSPLVSETVVGKTAHLQTRGTCVDHSHCWDRKAIEILTITGYAESGLEALGGLRMKRQYIPVAVLPGDLPWVSSPIHRSHPGSTRDPLSSPRRIISRSPWWRYTCFHSWVPGQWKVTSDGRPASWVCVYCSGWDTVRPSIVYGIDRVASPEPAASIHLRHCTHQIGMGPQHEDHLPPPPPRCSLVSLATW